MRRIRLVNLAFIIAIVLVWVIGSIVLRAPVWMVLIIGAVLVFASVLINRTLFQRLAAGVQSVAAAHPDALVMGTVVTTWESVDRPTRQRVAALVADRSGISLRDVSDAEVALIAASDILAIDLAPLGRTAFRPFRIQTVGHGTLDLAMSQVRPDDQVDAVVALRSAVGRTS